MLGDPAGGELQNVADSLDQLVDEVALDPAADDWQTELDASGKR
jgi:hypothetical protein